VVTGKNGLVSRKSCRGSNWSPVAAHARLHAKKNHTGSSLLESRNRKLRPCHTLKRNAIKKEAGKKIKKQEKQTNKCSEKDQKSRIAFSKQGGTNRDRKLQETRRQRIVHKTLDIGQEVTLQSLCLVQTSLSEQQR